MKNLKHIILIAASLWASAEAIDEAVVITPDEAMAHNFGPNHEYRFMNFLNLAVEQFSKRPSSTHPEMAAMHNKVMSILDWNLRHPLIGANGPAYNLDLVKITLDHEMFQPLHQGALTALTNQLVLEGLDKDNVAHHQYPQMDALYLAAAQLSKRSLTTNPEMQPLMNKVVAILDYSLCNPSTTYGNGRPIYNEDFLEIIFSYNVFESLHPKAFAALSNLLVLESFAWSFLHQEYEHRKALKLAVTLLPLAHPEIPLLSAVMEILKCNINNQVENDMNIRHDPVLLEITLAHDMFSDLHESALAALTSQLTLSN